ncbi:MAG: serine/threonine-protein kinase, partial [Gemmataceae bacterium]
MTRPDPAPTRQDDDLLGTNPPTERPTAAAPAFVAETPRPPPSPFAGFPDAGETLGDFGLTRVLGTGAFARVYLARQLSLGRLVALKVSRNKGREAQALARLEHAHIVGVFSESVLDDRDLHLLCMQYVPGTTLEDVIHALAALPPDRRDGRAILDAIDERAVDDTPFDLASLRDRERLAGMDRVEAVCWLGARLADALAHAHGHGVRHRDVKPANVLLNRYGRPLLADFNVAHAVSDGPGSIGGTPVYMAPEHLEAFNRDGTDPVDGRSDIYSLGLVLYHLYTGELAFGMPDAPQREAMRAMAAERRAGPPPLSLHAEGPPSLERVVARCLAGDPAARYASAAELADDLDACRELHRVRRELPPPRRLTRWGMASPVLYAAVLIPLPHLMGSVVNFTYNLSRIRLTDPQQDAFVPVALVYNLLAYPGCL